MITDKEIICRISIHEAKSTRPFSNGSFDTDKRGNTSNKWVAIDTKTFTIITDEYDSYNECLKDISNGLFDYTPFK